MRHYSFFHLSLWDIKEKHGIICGAVATVSESGIPLPHPLPTPKFTVKHVNGREAIM